MANTSSAKKMIRVAERRRLRNRAVRSEFRTYIRNAQGLIVRRDSEATVAIRQAIRALDKAVNKGVLHRNAAARRKSRLMKRFNVTLKAS